MTSTICPYPGLRPFTEEEAIFFKGRDLHIRQIVKLLEANKMAFITGASGDGKSSMVYAGVVPYIRAGFSRAKFNSWLVCDFKPQRNPLTSLAESAAKEMQLDYNYTIRELQRGFSALVDLYTNSEFYDDGNTTAAANRGKNLLIIADQFEEVFTMTENFHDGTPSTESYTTINLLLETVRISIARQLPVYVIFTMRSDFISQCTVFKDLPEFIAYSQFFVPQLKRTEIRQVIEEPALLAGGRVSSRLTEVLINNLNSGFDQLPVLQHALNLLWKTADNGRSALDLLHLAKIAGISRESLTAEERKDFDKWYAKLPYYQKKYFEKPDLNNVLNAHAGTLYESAYDHFMRNANWAEKSISPEESKMIIEKAFKTLTKIDNNRQVRNRCTVNEITGIINRPNITNATVCGVLNIFRAQENTLLRPFMMDNSVESQYLPGDTVLDVTHEALIRNWEMLSQWDIEELDNLKEYNDFNSQVQRWIDNGRSPEFLLASGNYAFFNDWYERCRPNPYWILKHDTSQRPQREKLIVATNRMEKCDEYMKQSHEAIIADERARRHKAIGILIGMLVFVLGLAAFSWWALSEKSEADKQKTLAEENARAAKEAQDEAQKQADAALKAEKEANQQRDVAREERQKALEAKNESDSARRLAEIAQREADRMRDSAMHNAEFAYNQKLAADSARQVALKEMERAQRASDSAAKLYYVALCNTLAMKAKNSYEDKSLNLRLANTACQMNLRGGNDKISPDLYDAMLFALEQNELLGGRMLKDAPFKSFTIDSDNRIVTIGDDGSIIMHRILSNGEIQSAAYDNNNQVAHTPIERAVFITPTLVAYSTKDRNSYVLDTYANVHPHLPVHNDYIQAASLSPDQNKFVVAYTKGVVEMMYMKSLDKPHAVHNFDTKISDIYFHGDNEVYVLCHNGSLKKWNYDNDIVSDVLPPRNDKNSFKMAAIPDKNLLAVCNSDGYIQFVNLIDDTPAQTMAGAHSKLENILYDQRTGILASSSADMRIALINTNDFNEKPLVIEEHSIGNRKIKCMGFNDKGVLFVMTDDNKMYLLDTDPVIYARTLFALNLAPLSPTEWDLILGREFSEK